MAGEQGKTPSASGEGTKEGTPSPTQTLEDVLKATQAIQQTQERLTKELAWQRSVGDKRDREYREILSSRTVSPDLSQDLSDPEAEDAARKILNTALAERDQRSQAQQDEIDLVKFKLDNSDWKESWNEIQEVVQDPTVAHLVDIKRPNGSRDYYLSLSNAKLQADVRRLRKAQAEAKVATDVAEAAKRKSEAMALTSGGTAVSEEDGETLSDLDSLKSDDILKKFPQLVDRRDQPKPLVP
jgi:hypothetical protein